MSLFDSVLLQRSQHLLEMIYHQMDIEMPFDVFAQKLLIEMRLERASQQAASHDAW